MSLVARITLLILAALLPLLLLEGYNQYALRTARVAQAHEQAQRTTELIGRNIVATVENTRALLAVVARLVPLADASGSVCGERLAALLPIYPQFRNIAVLDAEAQAVCTTARALPAEGVSLADRPYIQEATQTREFVFAPYMVSPVSGAPIMPSVYPIFGADGKVGGYVIVTFDLHWLSNYIATTLPEKSSATVANRSGIVIARSDTPSSWLGKPIPEPIDSARRKGGFGTFEMQGTDGANYIVGYVNLSHGLLVTTELFAPALLGSIDDATYAGLALALVAMLVAILGSMTVGNRVIALPLRSLVAVVQRWTQGDLAARAGEGRGGSELSVLSRGLNEMIARLDQREGDLKRLNETLEERVAQQTLTLKKEAEARREAEMSLQHSRRLEAIGQLTGGVAHDFNNLLTVILNGVSRAKRFRDDPAKQDKALDMASQGAERAATLTRQLLAFSRRQPLEPRVMQVNGLIVAFADVLRRTLGESIELEPAVASDLWNTVVDPTHLESALLNLALNARDAMPAGGKVTIETANATFDAASGRMHADVPPGDYVMISVADSGLGMTEDVAARAFEPFFTTKNVGVGSGLGLSQVYGFVKQTGGHIKIDSEIGTGTTVRIYLPRTRQEIEGNIELEGQTDLLPKNLSVLLVEDDDGVRNAVSGMLQDLGCTVADLSDGSSAVKMIEDSGRSIDVLICDVVLGGDMNGRAVAEQADRLRPGLPVLFISGYTRNAIVHNGRLDEGVTLLSKPFSAMELRAKLAMVLRPKTYRTQVADLSA